MRRWMASGRGLSIKRRKNIYIEGWRVKGRDNPVTLQCTGSRTWRKMKDNRVGNKKLLVARDN